jgi:hypothetical protein
LLPSHYAKQKAADTADLMFPNILLFLAVFTGKENIAPAVLLGNHLLLHHCNSVPFMLSKEPPTENHPDALV